MPTLHSLSPDPTRPRSESQVWDALSRLPQDWTVFHSVCWLDQSFCGEADFVILHPRHGMAVLEVKGGGITVDRGIWYTVNRQRQKHKIKNPFRQAMASSRALRDYLGARIGQRPITTHGVVFPDLDRVPDLGPDAEPEMVIVKPQMLSMEDCLVRLMGSHEELPRDVYEQMIELLAPTVRIAPHFTSRLHSMNQQFIDLTNQQVRLLNHLRRNRRFIITGGAGTGKTVLAVEQARRLATEGLNVLLTCYNEPLGEKLREEVKDEERVRACNFHNVALQEIERAGLPRPDTKSDEFWDETCPKLLVAAARKSGYAVDAIVVDEAQDFTPLWWSALEQLLKDGESGRFYIFGDPLQNIYRKADWQPPFDGFTYELSTNCRNSKPIAELVASLQGQPYDVLTVEGPEPDFVITETEEELLKNLEEVLGRLTQDGLKEDEIQVLCQTSGLRKFLRELKLNGFRFGELGAKAIAVETVHRFKGLEAPVVIHLQDRLNTKRDYRLASIGMSRAKAHLVVLASKKVVKILQALPRQSVARELPPEVDG